MDLREDEGQDDQAELNDFFFQKKPVDMIVMLRRQGTSYASELSNKADTTYSHAVKVMNRMEKHGLVTPEKRGRKKEYELTDKGETVAENLTELMENVDGMQPIQPEGGGKFSLDKVSG